MSVRLQALSRRDLLFKISCGTTCLSRPFPALADENPSISNNDKRRPYAPLEDLLPAARVKWTIDKAFETTAKIIADDNATDVNSLNNRALLVGELQMLLLSPRNYTGNRELAPVPKRPAKEYLDAYSKNRQGLNILAQPGARLVQSGEVDAWKRLKNQERRREENDEIRAALNIYTTSLNFRSDAYLLNVSPSERSQMIRQDRLPDIKQVIQSDMGVRYLYRNQILSFMQDVRAELEYQLGERDSGRLMSFDDLLELLEKAQIACNKWFDLIDERDVVEALRAVENEQISS
eukprot:CAMPEP_0172496998 /NCGR_PEP_ID=MMETSP1066-20121228/94736_1 /TAXON_ID=671091 /ORGANISM="Coscinodiscus wailesii, Strain CCMP2513" /LENGTH=291 /DNA_ID=CAMNT_0013269567 /DNA_START=188 /DNA_END=1063 /DNA_ORIENTATION=+